MIYPEIKNIHSADLEPPSLPPDPLDCEVHFTAFIGPSGSENSERFLFSVITPVRLARTPEAQWGRGKLIMASFDWTSVIQSVAQLLARCARPNWSDTLLELNKEVVWDVDSAPADA